MKLRNVFEFLGFKRKPKKYSFEIKEFDLGAVGSIRYAQWLHPRAWITQFSEQSIIDYRKFLEPGDFCIDIGAHAGDSTIPMGLAVGKEGKVLALEPNPYIYHLLEKNALLNRDQINIDSLMAAATTESGFIEFEYSDSGFCNGGRHENISALKHGHPFKLEVFGINLAHELAESFPLELEKLKFIKVDAEGYDLYVLQSIDKIIARLKPYVKVEVFKNTDSSYRETLFQLFSSKGYKIYKEENGNCTHGDTPLRPEDMTNWKHFDIIAVPPR